MMSLFKKNKYNIAFNNYLKYHNCNNIIFDYRFADFLFLWGVYYNTGRYENISESLLLEGGSNINYKYKYYKYKQKYNKDIHLNKIDLTIKNKEESDYYYYKYNKYKYKYSNAKLLTN